MRTTSLHGIEQGMDLRHFDSGLSEDERIAALNENKRFQSIKALGDKWLLSRDYTNHYVPVLSKKSA